MSIKKIISLIAALSLIFTVCAGYAEEAVTETETEAAVAAPAPAEKESEMTFAEVSQSVLALSKNMTQKNPLQ